jgi:hypothetical protein
MEPGHVVDGDLMLIALARVLRFRPGTRAVGLTGSHAFFMSKWPFLPLS